MKTIGKYNGKLKCTLVSLEFQAHGNGRQSKLKPTERMKKEN